ncbi:TetR/AcrR family transcriptional regulator [Kribbella sandramycini]|uniref:AcrR family transcriptional regulator n=1 Tax=Kribbella sandramycini TaxID=60450 RepID=A0A7Y4KZ43_9ACTN|nr:TetR/AcrR family transcriptional regulator [Kribbella sandramycini]MBB6569672.1 AcrR family transcriptional regulator [Kribbella sandramycini]NOL40496.1 TetR/AcrR family transcriptional regulator [Kribbella sandramycini]
MSGGKSRNRSADGLPPITARKIAARATALTAERGIDGWSLRELAADLDVYTAVIYHHIGSREDVLQAVCERVVAQMPCPPAELSWREWFTEFLIEGRTVLRKYPGVARRMSLSGPTVPSALRIIDRGITVLDRDGFGPDAVDIYIFLVGTAFLHVQLEDDRAANPEERQAARKVFIAHRNRLQEPGLAAVGAQLSTHHQLEAADAAAYARTVQLCLDGAQSQLS